MLHGNWVLNDLCSLFPVSNLAIWGLEEENRMDINKSKITSSVEQKNANTRV